MKKRLFGILGMCLALVGFVSAIGNKSNWSMNHGMKGNMMMGHYGMWIFGWLFMILVLVVLGLLAIWLFKQIQKTDKKKK